MSVTLRVLMLADQPVTGLPRDESCRARYEPQVPRVTAKADDLAPLDPALDLIVAHSSRLPFDQLWALPIVRECGLELPRTLSVQPPSGDQAP
jgi:hypothetical protein